jgi:alkylated DNA nucleotide flippase Atl1
MYDSVMSSGAVVGRIMRHSQAPEEQPWYWTITARVRTFQLTHVRESDTRG